MHSHKRILSLFWWLVRLLHLRRRKKCQLFGATPIVWFFFVLLLILKYCLTACLSTIPISYLAIYSTEWHKNVIQLLLQCTALCWTLHDAQKHRKDEALPFEFEFCFFQTQKYIQLKSYMWLHTCSPLSHFIHYDTHKNLTSVGSAGFASTYYSKQYNSLHSLFLKYGYSATMLADANPNLFEMSVLIVACAQSAQRE